MTNEFIIDLMTDYCKALRFSDKAGEQDDYFRGFNTAIDHVLEEMGRIKEDLV